MPEIIIVTKVTQTNKAFAFVFNGLNPESKSRNTADDAFEIFSQKLLHILHLLVFITCTFCFRSRSFPVTAMLTLLFHLFVYRQILIQALL